MPTSAADEYTTLCDEIRSLVDEPLATRGPSLAVLEDRLTEGYARALALEAEQLRLGRRIGELGAEIGRGEVSGDELATLASRLSHASSRLDGLRSLLAALRQRADVVRSARR